MQYWDAIRIFVNNLNQYRANSGSSQVIINYQLCEDCQQHNNWMATSGRFEHSDAGWCDSRENVGMRSFFGTVNYLQEAKQFFHMWQNCPSHRDNLLAAGFEVGLALYVSGNRVYATYRLR